MNKKKILLVALAFVLVIAISVAGTLAFLTQSTAEVTNTFVAQKGIIHKTDTDTGFKLIEHEYSATTKALTTTEVTENTYSGVLPKQKLPKDPKVSVNVETDAEIYLFIKVTNGTTLINATVDSTNWEAVDGYANVYVYKGTGSTNNKIKGTSTAYELTNVSVFKNGDTLDEVQAKGFAETDLPAAGTDGTVSLGTIKVQAYATQTESFADAATAWGSTFGA